MIVQKLRKNSCLRVESRELGQFHTECGSRFYSTFFKVNFDAWTKLWIKIHMNMVQNSITQIIWKKSIHNSRRTFDSFYFRCRLTISFQEKRWMSTSHCWKRAPEIYANFWKIPKRNRFWKCFWANWKILEIWNSVVQCLR